MLNQQAPTCRCIPPAQLPSLRSGDLLGRCTVKIDLPLLNAHALTTIGRVDDCKPSRCQIPRSDIKRLPPAVASGWLACCQLARCRKGTLCLWAHDCEKMQHTAYCAGMKDETAVCEMLCSFCVTFKGSNAIGVHSRSRRSPPQAEAPAWRMCPTSTRRCADDTGITDTAKVCPTSS